jgi:hypothetical protein
MAKTASRLREIRSSVSSADLLDAPLLLGGACFLEVGRAVEPGASARED